MKILVCMQYWEGDKKQAEDAAKLMADLLPEMSEIVEFAFVYRNDSSPPNHRVQIAAQGKFGAVYAWKCSRIGEGWPGGCNELAYGTLNWVPIERHLHGTMTHIDAIMLVESDVVFLDRNWDEVLMREWEATVKENKLVCGALIEPETERAHINGGAIFAWDAANRVAGLRGGPYTEAWDFTNRRSILENARPSRKFWLDYKRESISEDVLFAERDGIRPTVFHGVKDESARIAVRKHFDLK